MIRVTQQWVAAAIERMVRDGHREFRMKDLDKILLDDEIAARRVEVDKEELPVLRHLSSAILRPLVESGLLLKEEGSRDWTVTDKALRQIGVLP